jgi:16S rRNA (guanine(966)-N(2))-methyltransferase RsmD
MDKMRESVFACLGDIGGLSFLDIFSGSGIIALEASSRGADPVGAVEQDKQKRKTLLDNVSIAPQRINCHFMPAELFVKRGINAFDIIFLDPPFPYKFKWQLIADIAASRLAVNESRILIHRPHEDYQKEDIQGLKKQDTRRYGRSVVDFFIVQK